MLIAVEVPVMGPAPVMVMLPSAFCVDPVV